MIFSIVLIVIFLFLLYNGILLAFPLKKEAIYKNSERAEEFVYSNKSYSTVLVGSGLIGDFNAKPLQRKGLFNLYFPYSGSCAGVEIIALSGKVPRTLLVETNYLFKGFDTPLIRALFKPGLYKARFFLPILQKKHHLISFLKEVLRPARPIHMKTNKLPELLYYQSLEKYRNAYDRLPDINQYNEDLKKLRKYLDFIHLKGCTIFFLKCH